MYGLLSPYIKTQDPVDTSVMELLQPSLLYMIVEFVAVGAKSIDGMT